MKNTKTYLLFILLIISGLPVNSSHDITPEERVKDSSNTQVLVKDSAPIAQKEAKDIDANDMRPTINISNKEVDEIVKEVNINKSQDKTIDVIEPSKRLEDIAAEEGTNPVEGADFMSDIGMGLYEMDPKLKKFDEKRITYSGKTKTISSKGKDSKNKKDNKKNKI